MQPPVLMGPQQQLALSSHQQQFSLPQPQQQLVLSQPHQQLAIDYDPRGVKRENTDIRVGDRKKVLLEDERTDSVKRKREDERRNIESKIRKLNKEATEYMQSGEGFSKLLEKIEASHHYGDKFADLYLKDMEIGYICECVRIYLAGVMQFDDEMKHNIEVSLQDQCLRRDMDDINNEKYSIEEKCEFLLNTSCGVKMVCFACDYLLGNIIDYCNLKCQERQTCCKQLKKKIKKIKRKDDESEEEKESGDEK